MGFLCRMVRPPERPAGRRTGRRGDVKADRELDFYSAAEAIRMAHRAQVTQIAVL
jgi:hypothetical protein